jgi:ribosomal protein S27AE
MPHPRTTHRITEIDLTTRTAVCAVCGPTHVYSRGHGRWRCGKAHTDSKRSTRARNTEMAATALKVATPCCGRRRALPPLRFPKATAPTTDLVHVTCSCGRQYAVIRLHQPAEHLAAGWPPDYSQQATAADEVIWAAGFAYYDANGEPDTNVTFMIDGEPSLGGVLDPPRLLAALNRWVFEGEFENHWQNPGAWHRDPVVERRQLPANDDTGVSGSED